MWQWKIFTFFKSTRSFSIPLRVGWKFEKFQLFFIYVEKTHFTDDKAHTLVRMKHEKLYECRLFGFVNLHDTFSTAHFSENRSRKASKREVSLKHWKTFFPGYTEDLFLVWFRAINSRSLSPSPSFLFYHDITLRYFSHVITIICFFPKDFSLLRAPSQHRDALSLQPPSPSRLIFLISHTHTRETLSVVYAVERGATMKGFSAPPAVKVSIARDMWERERSQKMRNVLDLSENGKILRRKQSAVRRKGELDELNRLVRRDEMI